MSSWTPERTARFQATMKAKREARGIEEIPLSDIPAPKRARKPRKHRKTAPKPLVNGAVQMHAEVDAKSGELCLVLGPLRIPLRLR